MKRPRPYRPFIKAFTLIELMIVTIALAVVSLAIYAVLSNGVRIWQRAQAEMPEEDVNIFFDKLELDLRNSLGLTNICFMGSADRLEIPTLISSRRLRVRTVGKVVYVYNQAKGLLNREEMDYSGIYSSSSSPGRAVLDNVSSLKFQYYVYDAEKNEYIWQDEQLTGALPIAVRVEMEAVYGKDQSSKFTKTVGIPISD